MTHPRVRFALAALATIALGLASRPLGRVLPWLSDPLGDACYALLLFWLVRIAAPRLPVVRAAAVAFCLCTLVEISQLCHAPWLDAVRRTTAGHLVLGWGFDPIDLLWYALGAGAGAALARPPRSRPLLSGAAEAEGE